MYKKIGLSLVYLSLFLGLYGCSCSEKPKNSNAEAGLYVADITVNEGDSGTTSLEFTVNLQRENQDTVTVRYDVSAVAVSVNSVATAGDDFESKTNQTLVFDAESDDTQTISLTIVNDTLYEHDEDFLVTLTAASGAKIVNGQARVTIKDNDPKPVASLSVVSELNSNSFAENEIDRLELKVALNTPSGVDAEVSILKSRESETDLKTVGKTAAHRVDYLLKDAAEKLMETGHVLIKAGDTEAIINLDIVDDGIPENTESFTLTLNEIADVNVSGANLTFEITDNDQVDQAAQLEIPLNDTGLTQVNGVNITVDDLPEGLTTQEEIEFEADQLTEALQNEMDKAIGRDAAATANPATLTKVGGGRAGFDFTKLDSEGNETTAELITEGTAVTIPWDCVRDNNTGLVWEVKTRGNLGLRAASRNFYWYDPNFETNGGVAGHQGDFECDETNFSACNTSYYVADVNAKKLCGLSGWRMPTMNELRSIVDYNVNVKNISVAYDTDYFAGDVLGTSYVWTSTTYAADPAKAWAIRFGQGVIEEARDKSTQYLGAGIRLVNDSLIKQAQQQ